jgi:hypothetical protein
MFLKKNFNRCFIFFNEIQYCRKHLLKNEVRITEVSQST